MSSVDATGLAHHFEDLEQQREAATLGMWAFLVTEIMFFGGLFGAYVVYRTMYPEAWDNASNQLDVFLGAVNTTVLIGSSLTMALAVRCAAQGKNKAVAGFTFLTLLLGFVFLGVKVIEYTDATPLPAGNMGIWIGAFTDKSITVLYFDDMRVCGLSAPFTSTYVAP